MSQVMKWFGTPHGAPYEAHAERALAPVGARCAQCGEVIGWHDDGLLIPHLGEPEPTPLPYHCECVRGAIGGLGG